MLQKYWPMALLILSNTFYHICTKSTPDNVNPFASLAVTYLVGAAVSVALFYIMNRGGNLLREFGKINWTGFVLGVAIVGLECGYIYLYKAGWTVSMAQIAQSALLAIVLLIVGKLLFHESISVKKLAGAAVCMIGLYLLNS